MSALQNSTVRFGSFLPVRFLPTSGRWHPFREADVRNGRDQSRPVIRVSRHPRLRRTARNLRSRFGQGLTPPFEALQAGCLGTPPLTPAALETSSRSAGSALPHFVGRDPRHFQGPEKRANSALTNFVSSQKPSDFRPGSELLLRPVSTLSTPREEPQKGRPP